MQTAVHITLVVVQVLFAGLAMAGRYVLPYVPPGVLVTFRVLGAAAVLAAIQTARGGPWVRDRRDLVWLFSLGMLGIAANQSLYLIGLHWTTAINATILVATTPVFTVLGSVLLGREPLSAAKLGGIALAAIGTVYLIGPDRLSLAPAAAVGNALIVVAMLCYAAYFLLAKPLLERIDALTATTYVMVFALVGVVPLGVLDLPRFHPAALAPSVWWWVGFIVVFPTLVTYLLNIWALRRASSNLVAVYVYLQPVITALVAPRVLRGEALTSRAMLSGIAVLAGLMAVVWAERGSSGPAPAMALPSE
jgi:drug/metabolite transporter (DMT)-like permease